MATKTRAPNHDILDKDFLDVEFDSFAPPATLWLQPIRRHLVRRKVTMLL